jgi:hypothetical protein
VDVIFFSMAQQPLFDYVILNIEVSRSHSDTPHSVGLLCTSDQTNTETSTWQHTTLTTDRIGGETQLILCLGIHLKVSAAFNSLCSRYCIRGLLWPGETKTSYSLPAVNTKALNNDLVGYFHRHKTEDDNFVLAHDGIILKMYLKLVLTGFNCLSLWSNRSKGQNVTSALSIL